MVKLIVVAGSGSGCGKTTAVCRILRAIPGLAAVKISPREEQSRVEWGPGEDGKDTHLYSGHGAVCVARIIGPRDSVAPTWELVKERLGGCLGVVIEGASGLKIPGKRFVVFVDSGSAETHGGSRNRELAAVSNVIIERSSHFDSNRRAIVRCSNHNSPGNMAGNSPLDGQGERSEHDLIEKIQTFLAATGSE